MSSKYSALPDIDNSHPDVYETPDNTEETHILSLDDQGQLSEGDSEDVIRTNLPVKDAANRFKGASVDATGAGQRGPNQPSPPPLDFSDRLTKRKKAMYRTFVNRAATLETSEYEVLPKELVLQETPLQKLRRLVFEVQELNDEVDKAKEPSTTLPPLSHSDLLASISSLQNDLSQISQHLGEAPPLMDHAEGTPTRQHEESKTLIRQLEQYKNGAVQRSAAGEAEDPAAAAGDGKTITYELFYTPDTVKITTLAKTAEMDDRIARIERLVGSSSGQNFGDLVSGARVGTLL
ncbi:Dynamitin-domain-containing protein [Jimgerdemannia flammicorona]|uniref:Dynamitin-domain-containing protein n=1 Tax=Jimgerdemannia flammicorona TaxID=994334 RepID=A0A433DBY3_9FUNG|nr:Dynamitin-domain-containing protein [Jimgerdemannia flammicorona]